MTSKGVILEAAYQLSKTSTWFTLEDLCVAAWKLAPDKFGLDGFDLPNNNKVLCALYGKNGLLYGGQLTKRDDNRLRLTPKQAMVMKMMEERKS